MTHKFKAFFAASALRLLRLLRAVARGLAAVSARLGRLSAPLGRVLVRFFILPLYRLWTTVRLRIRRLALPARGVVFFLLTNRYLLHATLGLLAAVTIGVNLQGRQAYAQDIGQQSILFALASQDRVEIVQEDARPESRAMQPHYLGAATIQSIPNVDFDYDEGGEPVSPSVVVPGTIAVQPYESVTETSRAPRTRSEKYVVQDNDTVSSIANRFGVNVGTILWNNNLTERAYIRPGDTLVIPPVSGLLVKVKSGDTLSKLATRYGVDAAEIANVNTLTSETQLAIGMELVIPGARPPEIQNTRTQIVSRPDLPTPPVPFTPTQKPEDADTRSLAATRLFWPTSGHVITQYYGWRHTGVDIDGDYTSPIYAAQDGVVEKAGWNAGGYGLMVLVDGQNAVKTRYGHASKLFVKAGDAVKRGQVIAMVGTTGRSTGTHLHFEVYIKGVRTNPLSYIR